MTMMEEDLEASPSESSRLIVSSTSSSSSHPSKQYQLDPTRYGHNSSKDNNDSENAENILDDKYLSRRRRQRRKINSVLMVVVPFVLMAVIVVGKGVLNNHNSNNAESFWLGGPSFFNAKSLFDTEPIFENSDKKSKSSFLEEETVASQKEVGSSSFDDDAIIADDQSSDQISFSSSETEPEPEPEVLSRQQQDKITSLPGLDHDPGFDMYSGYFPVDPVKDTRHIFYWYVESQGDPANDPVMFWTNGGPGCSGLYAFAVEHGPFFWNADGTLFDNPNSWNKIANILYVEIPIGVGFSYSTQPEIDYSKWGDKETAIDNLEVIKQFFKRFPQRRSNDFYISSESYGGHYMPQLTMEILLYNRKLTNTNERINFKGTMVGNPYVDPYTNDLTQFQTWYDHGLLPWPLYQEFVRGCVNKKHHFTSKCLDLMNTMYAEVGKGISPYGLDFPVCLEAKFSANTTWKGNHYTYTETHSDSDVVDKDHNTRTRRLVDMTVAAVDGATEKMTNTRSGFMDPRSTFSNQTIQLLNRTKAGYRAASDDNYAPLTKPEEDFLPCQSNHLSAYMNRPDVVKALHANPDTLPWRDCSRRLEYSYTDHVRPQVGLYKQLIQMMEFDPFDFLVFSGDDDSICSLAGTQAWIWDIGADWEEQNTWNPWYVDGQTAGYVTQFDVTSSKKKKKSKHKKKKVERDLEDLKGAKSSFTLVTVHGAGHEVPAYRPREALTMLDNFLAGTWRL
eukprot:CAMPEP_0113486040 /NCGR_PEP_ID=MMETSP0014_2-20120614/24792_1 /TAXON_ID=2857 /ORGANISM="Nitzschia sp." /LENGTH=731 /DNA_ID=CAMNT_0000379701 /DNA_START=112 /DNA_END=2307 /DNA_ORIENTATION=+ /assembly_acc=CAM_ASM_000159